MWCRQTVLSVLSCLLLPLKRKKTCSFLLFFFFSSSITHTFSAAFHGCSPRKTLSQGENIKHPPKILFPLNFVSLFFSSSFFFTQHLLFCSTALFRNTSSNFTFSAFSQTPFFIFILLIALIHRTSPFHTGIARTCSHLGSSADKNQHSLCLFFEFFPSLLFCSFLFPFLRYFIFPSSCPSMS